MLDTLFISWNVSPNLYEGFITLKYYSLLFGISFLLGHFLMKKMFVAENCPEKWLDKILVYAVVGTVLGARLGHVFFYDWDYFSQNLSEIPMVWKGGLASHGAAIAIIISMWIYSKKITKKSVLWILDKVVITVAIAACFIRVGNLMNSEIIGNKSESKNAFFFQHKAENSIARFFNVENEAVKIESTEAVIMKSYTLKVYPHMYMDKVNNDDFKGLTKPELAKIQLYHKGYSIKEKADTLAYDVSQLVLQMLEASNVLFKDLSSNEGYEFEIQNPNSDTIKKVVDKILLIFSGVSKREAWLEFPIQPEIDGFRYPVSNLTIDLNESQLKNLNAYYQNFVAFTKKNHESSDEHYFSLEPNKEFPKLVDNSIVTQIGIIPRIPTQLLEAFSYLFIFLILFWGYWKRNWHEYQGLLFGLFLTLLFGVRFFIEFYKEHQTLDGNVTLNMGQWLSIPAVVLGFVFIFIALRKKKQNLNIK